MSSIKAFCVNLFFLLALSSYAQSPNQWEKHGKQAIVEKDWYAAIEYYKKAYYSDTSKTDNALKLAKAYRMNNNYSAAEKWYSKAYNRSEINRYKEVSYWLAKMQQSLGKYDLAKQNYTNYTNYGGQPNTYFWKDAKQQVLSCIWAKTHKNDTLKIKVKNAEFSNNYTDFGGTLINDSTMFYSSLPYSKNKKSLNIDKSEKEKKIQLYSAIFKDSIWKKTTLFDTTFNTIESHLGNPFFYADSNWLFYTECLDLNNCKIKYRKWNKNSWSNPVELPPTINLEGFTATQPCLVNINRKPTLFFVSNRPQGKGNLDIWYATYDKRLNGFKYPRNMGKKVNSPGNETTPFYNKHTKELFFSSNWWKGLGGYDIFKVVLNSLKNTSTVKNLLYPINSTANDLYYWQNNDSTMKFLSSNRAGGHKLNEQTCCNDIYYTYNKPISKKTDTLTIDSLAKDTNLINTLPVKITRINLNNYLPILYFDNNIPNPGSYSEKTNKNYSNLFHDFIAKKDTYQEAYKPTENVTNTDSIIAAFFDNKIMKGLTDLNRFLDLLIIELKKSKHITITLKGYASPLASSTYNLKLSQRRIASVINYIKTYKHKALLPYFNIENKKGQLKIVEIPFGENNANKYVSDSRVKKSLSVYSPSAIQERRIEIINITEEK